MTTHTLISYLKSAIRIWAGIALIQHFIFIAGVLIIAAEVFGVLEELPGAYKGTKTS